eukprot:NODE_1065_length_1078_cov_1200.986395_g740_i3.p2 GENE.NODE_1065_length_1078_cov_1200.986395_g740_i3~~NODE_1065_length_1078_cov_1200.986395_g740_i3.p2  ORF type:complete len:241 (+),score=112.10 NODE_1065_length_1078_cov_1200.986395_g740_i3:55-723(+)
MNTFIFVILLALPSVLSLGFYNQQLATNAHYNNKGHTIGKNDPRLNFPPNYVQELAPWHDFVLLSLEQARDNNGWNYNHATVVRVGPMVTETDLLKEGATVIISDACKAVWASKAEYLAAYPLHEIYAASTRGRFKNGVSLNNAWAYNLNTDAEHQSGQNANKFANLNANQQFNYLVCKESEIYGVVGEEWGGADRGKDGLPRMNKPDYSNNAQPQFWVNHH